jgi:hypothetical protein
VVCHLSDCALWANPTCGLVVDVIRGMAACHSSDCALWANPYMVSSRFARLRVFNDRDRVASVYPACW